jgi:hypothetical protein
MCSHFLASQLYIRGDDLPEFYLSYCTELKEWSDHKWPTRGELTVEQAQYALWVWYRAAYKGQPNDRNRIKREFVRNPFVQEQRKKQIARSLNRDRRIDLARVYVSVDPTVAAIIAWREFDVALGGVFDGLGIERTGPNGKKLSIPDQIRRLPNTRIPVGWSKESLIRIWCNCAVTRNDVMHEDRTIDSSETASGIVEGVDAFIAHSFPDV